eukprot:Hpha_TRINITY_DN15321_c0_g1::TRINITY_DN15321_c0_g1_i1::g.89631::m.89631/K05970/SIAE; sialate O-acetylesterase
MATKWAALLFASAAADDLSAFGHWSEEVGDANHNIPYGPDGTFKLHEMFVGAPEGARGGGGTPVLASDEAVPLWGWARGVDKSVTVSLDGAKVATATVKSLGDGNYTWITYLPPQRARYNATLVVESDGGAKATSTLAFGVVVLCSGQSNMGMAVGYRAPHTFYPPGFGPANKTSFSADNGTAENDNAHRYTGRIMIRTNNGKYGLLRGNQWQAVTNESLGAFSAVCWYSGKNFYEAAGLEASGTPLGLIVAAVGGSPIEYWIPPKDPSNPMKNPCENDTPQCDNQLTDSQFWGEYMTKMIAPGVSNVGYKIHLVVWDQAERDTKCPKSLAAYPCMQRYLISSWQQRFNSSFAYVGVQLAGYTGALNNGTGTYGVITADMVYQMRMQQERGCHGVPTPCSVVPTYDFSCSAGSDGGCPYGSVHQPDKPDIGRRVGLLLHQYLRPSTAPRVVEGPRAVSATVSGIANNAYKVELRLEGGSAPFSFRGTRNCTACCNGAHTLDLDVSTDGQTWTNVTGIPTTPLSGSTLSFGVTLPAAPTQVRHTHGAIWAQCALYNAEGLPLFPFDLGISKAQQQQ